MKFIKKIAEMIANESQQSVPTFFGKSAITDYIEYVTAGSLFFCSTKTLLSCPA